MKREMRNTIYSKVCDRLRGKIISGAYPPGRRLKMVDLVQEFGISAMPIREALQQLQGEGLVTIDPHRGARVRQVDRDFVIMVHDLRTAIECMLGRKACMKITPNGIEAAEKIQRKYDRAVEERDAAKMVAANLRFHELIYDYAGNSLALQVLKTHSALIRGIRTRFGYTRGRPEQVCREHRRIIEALRQQDPWRLEKALWEHCQNAAADFINLFEENS